METELEIERIADELLSTIKNYVDKKTTFTIENQKLVPPETVINTNNNSNNMKFSQDSIVGLTDALVSLSNEIKFLRKVIGV